MLWLLSFSAYLFSKSNNTKISNSFYNCIDKLLKIKIEDFKTPEIDSLNDEDDDKDKHQIINYNNKLKKYGLMYFQHRLVNKALYFAHNIITNEEAPFGLKQMLENSNMVQ